MLQDVRITSCSHIRSLGDPWGHGGQFVVLVRLCLYSVDPACNPSSWWGTCSYWAVQFKAFNSFWTESLHRSFATQDPSLILFERSLASYAELPINIHVCIIVTHTCLILHAESAIGKAMHTYCNTWNGWRWGLGVVLWKTRSVSLVHFMDWMLMW